MATARLASRLADFGEPDITEPVQLLADAIADTEHVSDIGALLEREALHTLLVNRLRIVDHLAGHPEVAATVPDRPIFIVGLPRTGTTLLQHVLASHPDVRAIEGWEAADPVPTRGEARRRAMYRLRLAWVKALVPSALTVHPMGPEGPEEGLDLIDRTLYSRRFAFFGHPRYAAWLGSRTVDEVTVAYRFYVDQLRLLLWQRPGRLLEKSPALLGLEGVLAHHMPDAMFVVTHRDLEQVIPSALSLSAVVRTATQRVDPLELGPRLAQDLRVLVEGMLEPDPGVDPDRVVHVRFSELTRDPHGVVGRLLERLELAEPSDLAERVDAVSAELPRDKNGTHVYDLEQFGVDWADFGDLARDYSERFGIG